MIEPPWRADAPIAAVCSSKGEVIEESGPQDIGRRGRSTTSAASARLIPLVYERDRKRGCLRQLIGCRLRTTGPGAALGEPALVRADDDLAAEISLEDRVHRRDGDAAGTDAVEVARLVIAAAVQRIAEIFGVSAPARGCATLKPASAIALVTNGSALEMS